MPVMQHSTTSVLQRVTLLIVDDDRIMRSIISDALARLGFTQILQARHGEEAIQLMQQQDVDIVICDWVMRPMDGIEFTRFIRQHPDSPDRFVPIILTTGRSELKDVETARDAGVTEYLTKPFDIRSLCDRIISVVERPRSFVVSRHFKGPDRRRRGDAPAGQERRHLRGKAMPAPSELKAPTDVKDLT